MSATPINPAAATAREAARQAARQFGTQTHAEAGEIPVSPVFNPIRFAFDGIPE